jgi:AraC-like DNA-binding protein
VHENGRPAANDLAVVSGYSASIIPLSSSEAAFDIILQADKFRFPYGTIYNIRIGSFVFLNESLQKYNFLSVFLLIAIFILGLNQLILFLLQRRHLWRSERLYLYFGLCCFGQLLFGIGAHHTYWSLILPSFPWGSLSMCMMSAIYIGDLFFLLYFRRLFPLDVPKSFFYIFGILYVIFGLITAFLPGMYIAYIVPAYHAHSVVSTVIFIFLIIRTAAKRRENSMLVLYGALAAIVLGAVITFLLGFEIIEGYLDVYSLSMVLFGLVQTITTMRNFIRMQHHSLQITEDNIKLKAIIDRKMASANVITGNIEAKINTALDYLAENYRDDISRENLAAALDLHPDNFSRYFKLHTGKGYNEYLNDLRIAEAVRLLKETDIPVGLIWAQTGFQSSSTFSRVFIKAIGCQPNEFRKKR